MRPGGLDLRPLDLEFLLHRTYSLLTFIFLRQTDGRTDGHGQCVAVRVEEVPCNAARVPRTAVRCNATDTPSAS